MSEDYRRVHNGQPRAPQPQPVTVPPQPVAVQIVVGAIQADDGAWLVVLQVNSPTGQAVYFLPHEAAAKVADMIFAKARECRAGIIVPGQPIEMPGGDS